MDLPTTHYDKPVEEKVAVSTPRMKLEKFSSYLMLLAIFLAPLVFFPSLYMPLDLVKTAFLGVIVILAAILHCISSLRNKTPVMPRSALVVVSLGILISVLISSFLSLSPMKSFFGQGFEMGTASFIFLMFLSAFLVSRMVARDKETVVKIYTMVLGSFVLLALFHIVRMIGGGSILSFGVLGTPTATVLGRWYDFGIMTALVAILSLLGLKLLPLGKGMKRLLSLILIVCGVLLTLVNFVLAWGALAFTALCIGIYEYKTRMPKGTGFKSISSRISIMTLVIFIIACVGMWKGSTIVAAWTHSLKIEYGEAVLPWQLTADVTTATLKESPLFGAGPNRFGFQYLRSKPLEVNQTPFWNSEFVSGSGTLPTFVTTQGLLGLILWCLFFIYFVRDGVRLLRKPSDPARSFLIASSFFSALFLWIINLVYNPSHVMLFLTFIFTGIFVGVVLREKTDADKALGQSLFPSSSRFQKLMPIVSALALIILILWLGISVKKTVAVAYFQKGIQVLNTTKSVDVAEADFKKALSWDTSDIYYQALSEINIMKINTLAQDLQNASVQNPSAALDQKKIDQVVMLTNDAVKDTKAAQKIDPYNYYNYIAEAHISEVAGSLKVPNAYTNAENSYSNALKTNPYNPGIYLSLARLEATENKLALAQQNVGRALQLKQNYTEAIYLLSQIQVTNGQLKEAITSAQVATQITTNEPLLFFQLGILLYNDKDYVNAAAALEKATSLEPQYANARYFLGLSDVRLGKNEEAIAQFTELARTNPDNQEVAFILLNLKEGKSPFADAKPPIDNKPEKRKTLPVAEKTVDKTAKK